MVIVLTAQLTPSLRLPMQHHVTLAPTASTAIELMEIALHVMQAHSHQVATVLLALVIHSQQVLLVKTAPPMDALPASLPLDFAIPVQRVQVIKVVLKLAQFVMAQLSQLEEPTPVLPAQLLAVMLVTPQLESAHPVQQVQVSTMAHVQLATALLSQSEELILALSAQPTAVMPVISIVDSAHPAQPVQVSTMVHAQPATALLSQLEHKMLAKIAQ